MRGPIDVVDDKYIYILFCASDRQPDEGMKD